MFELTKKTDYGIELLIALASHFQSGPVPLREIAKEKRLSFKFLEQVAIPLRERGLIEAKEGKGGGYFLKENPKKIFLREIMEVLEGGVSIKDCQECLRKKVCSLKNVWRDLEDILEKELDKKSLKDLV